MLKADCLHADPWNHLAEKSTEETVTAVELFTIQHAPPLACGTFLGDAGT